MFEINRGKKTRVDVLYADEERTFAEPPARELARCLRAAAGGRLTVRPLSETRCPLRIVLQVNSGLGRRYRQRVPRPLNVVAWTCDGGNALTLSGNSAESLWLAVYAFLEEVVGCRWFFPGELGEDIPRLTRLRIGRLRVTRTPSFVARDFRWWPEEFQRKKLTGGFTFTGGHCYRAIIPESEKARHPEYFSEVNGKRLVGQQLCITHPDVEDYALQYLLRCMEEDPRRPMVPLCPDDSNVFCNCRSCTEAYLGRTLRGREKPDAPHFVTRGVFGFANRVAARFAEHYPDTLVVVYAYARYKECPPDLKVRENVLVWYCNQPIPNWHGEAGRRTMQNDVRSWSTSARHIGIFDYIVNQSWPGMPRPVTRMLADYLKFYHRHGVRYYYTQCGNDFGVNLPNYYLTAALCWDVKRDPQEVLDDLYRRCFPASGKAVKRYFEILERAVGRIAGQDLGPGVLPVGASRRSHECIAAMFTPAVVAQAEEAIADARRLARTKVEKGRLKLVAAGFLFLKTAAHAARKTFEFENNYRFKPIAPWAWNIGNYDYRHSLEKMDIMGEPCVNGVRELIRLWKEYAALRERLEREYVLTRKYAHGASFNPLPTLENLWKLYTGEAREIPRLVTGRNGLRDM